MQRKRLLPLLCAACAALTLSVPAHALSGVTNWAQAEVAAAQEAGLAPASLESAKATAPITRAEFCEIALALYEHVSGKAAPKAGKSPFADTANTAVLSAASLGIVGGRGGGVFDPGGAVTRQELCKMLDSVLTAASCEKPAADAGLLAVFPDRSVAASWAEEPVSRMLGAEILRGVSRTYTDPTGELTTVTELRPAGTTTREQALILALRFSEAFEAAPAQPTIETDKPADKVEKPTTGTSDPEGTGGQAGTGDQAGTGGQGDAPATTPTIPSTLPSTKEEKMAFVFGASGSFFESPAVAEAAMTEIAVPVWRLSNGKKTSDKAYIKVNRNLSAIYTAIFIEIYNGDEQFPISDVGSYAWRPSPTSEHRWGTAIDLNYDANMEATIGQDGTMTPTTGTHWTPGEDPLSIPEGGDVYNAFTKYGFAWGGNAWKTKRDYMHFSYFGT